VSTIRDRVLLAAHQAGFHLLDLARQLNIRSPTLHGGLARNRPTYKHLAKIAEICRVSVDWLRSGDPVVAPSWWHALPGGGVPADAIGDDGGSGPTHLLARIRNLEEEKLAALAQRDEARRQLAGLQGRVGDLTDTVARQAVQLAKLHAYHESAATPTIAG
jgi:transcriptional regulator with XRE-family HTH domain